jgi:hypothetical protein
VQGLAAATAVQPDVRLPEIVAARMVDDQLDIRLAAPHPTPPPGPWTVDESGCWWSIRVGDDLPAAATDADQQLAPYPTLVAVGHDQTGGNWLLDLESAGALALTGDPGRCLDLGRFIAAELAVNAWSDQLTVTMVGFGAELVPLNPDRLRYTDDLNSAASLLAGDLRTVLEARATVGIDVLSGRMRGVAGDSWMPQVLLVAPQVTHVGADDGTLERLLTSLREHPERTAVAVVLVGEQESTWSAMVPAAIAADGSLSIPGLGLQMTAQQLPAEQVGALGSLLAHASMVTDSPMPAAAGSKPYERFVDAAGGLRPEFTLPRAPLGPATPTLVPAGATAITIRTAPSEIVVGSATSVLPYADEAYLRDGATTEQDLQALAPRVDDERRAAIIAANASLDVDLADWRDQHSMTPKLILLGPVELRAHGTRPPKRISYYTEVAAFLATRDHGATAEQVAAAFEVSMTSIYSRLTVVRNWLGTNPATGEKYLPDSTKSDAGQARGVGVYECDGLLVDAELFRRLRARGEALGGDEGIAYLEAALSLVEGPPFDHLRPGGYGWLADKPLDHYLAAGIVDVAHTVHLHHLHAGNLEQARTAAETAQKAAPYEDTPRLDLVAVMRATGHSEEADRYLREEICNRSEDGEAPDDLPERTEAVVREWQSRAS